MLGHIREVEGRVEDEVVGRRGVEGRGNCHVGVCRDLHDGVGGGSFREDRVCFYFRQKICPLHHRVCTCCNKDCNVSSLGLPKMLG